MAGQPATTHGRRLHGLTAIVLVLAGAVFALASTGLRIEHARLFTAGCVVFILGEVMVGRLFASYVQSLQSVIAQHTDEIASLQSGLADLTTAQTDTTKTLTSLFEASRTQQRIVTAAIEHKHVMGLLQQPVAGRAS
jgi:hypothetical protein